MKGTAGRPTNGRASVVTPEISDFLHAMMWLLYAVINRKSCSHTCPRMETGFSCLLACIDLRDATVACRLLSCMYACVVRKREGKRKEGGGGTAGVGESDAGLVGVTLWFKVPRNEPHLGALCAWSALRSRSLPNCNNNS